MGTSSELLGPLELAESGPAEAVRLPLDVVEPHPDNPRRTVFEIEELADNIRSFGLLQPVTVRRIGERYELLGGHRRRIAFSILREKYPDEIQWRSIPAVLKQADDDDLAFLMLLSGQLHSRSWQPREEAAALERLVQGGRTLRQVAEAINWSESRTSKRLRVYADAVLSGYVQTGRLAPGTAEEFLTVADPAQRKDLAERAVEEEWSQDRARGAARALRLDLQVREVARRARELLEILSQIDPSQLPKSATKDLWTLRARIDMIGRGGPVMPSLDQAKREAGDTDSPRRRRSLPKRGHRLRSQRVMPAAAAGTWDDDEYSGTIAPIPVPDEQPGLDPESSR